MNILDAIVNRRSYRLPFKPDPISDEHKHLLIEAARWAPSPFNIQPWAIRMIESQKEKSAVARLTARAIRKQFRDARHLDLVGKWTRLTVDEWENSGDGVLVDDHVKLPEFIDREKLRPVVENLRHLSYAGWFGAGALPAGEFRRLVERAPLLMLFLIDRKRKSPGESGDTWILMGMGAMVQNVHLMAGTLGIGAQYVNAALEGTNDRRRLAETLKLPEEYEPVTLLRLGYVESEQPRSVRRPAREILIRSPDRS